MKRKTKDISPPVYEIKFQHLNEALRICTYVIRLSDMPCSSRTGGISQVIRESMIIEDTKVCGYKKLTESNHSHVV